MCQLQTMDEPVWNGDMWEPEGTNIVTTRQRSGSVCTVNIALFRQ